MRLPGPMGDRAAGGRAAPRARSVFALLGFGRLAKIGSAWPSLARISGSSAAAQLCVAQLGSAPVSSARLESVVAQLCIGL